VSEKIVEKKINLILATIFLLAAINTGLNYTSTPKSDKETVVMEVVDGDTLDIVTMDEVHRVRVLGIDTPEVHGKNTPNEFYLKNTSKNRKCLAKIGEKASNYAKQKVKGQKINLTKDPGSDNKGSYGRLLRYIEYNQTSLGKELLQKGYARVYNSSFSKINEYRQIEKQTRKQRKGIWNEDCTN
jgi:micrococcal nuclease